MDADSANSLFQPTLHLALVLGLSTFVLGLIIGFVLWRKDRAGVRELVDGNKALRREVQNLRKGTQNPAGERENT